MTKQENEERLARLKGIVLSMPEKPGSYQYYDENHTIIYVGKAKNLKRRVSSYFHKEVDRYKTKVLVSKILTSHTPSSIPKKMHFCWKTALLKSIIQGIMFC